MVGSNVIAIKDSTVQKVVDKFGRQPIEELLYEYDISGTIEALTESEAAALIRFKSIDSLRARLNEAENERSKKDDARKKSKREIFARIVQNN